MQSSRTGQQDVWVHSLEKGRQFMNWLINIFAKMRLFKGDLDYHMVRASRIIIYFYFGY